MDDPQRHHYALGAPRAPRFVLNPAVRVLWRTDDSVSLELGPDAVVLDGVDQPFMHDLLHSEGTPLPGLDDEARRDLHDAGYLWPADVDDPRTPLGGPPVDARRTPPAPRLGGELLSLTVRHGERATEVLDARRVAYVAVDGTGRAGPLVAAALAASGVGRVRCTADGTTRLHQALPGGLSPLDEGRPRRAVTESAILRAAPGTETGAPAPGELPDLVVLAIDEPLDEQQRRLLHADGVAYLPVSLGPGVGGVGPLVLPGLTSCVRCADLHRSDRDPQWPSLAAQLTLPRRHGPASDVTVALAVAAAATGQALAFLDGEHPATIDGSLELHRSDWRLRRRTRPAHADCDCGAGTLGTMTG